MFSSVSATRLSDGAPAGPCCCRDCIGIAKTGSGKTLAFVLPLLRHAKDQPPLAQGDGPIDELGVWRDVMRLM